MSLPRKMLLALIAGSIGFIINLFPIEIFPGIHLIFGSAVALVVATLYGPLPGGLAGLLAGARTWTLWNQAFPVSMLLYGLEGLVVGQLKQRYPRLRPLFAILIYWVALGGWLNLLAQYLLFNLSFETSLFIQIRSIVNGLICGLIVESLLLTFSFVRRRRLSRDELKPASMATVVSIFLTIGLSLPILYASTSYARSVRERLLAKTFEANEQQINSTSSEVSALLESYQRALELTAAIIESESETKPQYLQRLLATTRARYPIFAGLYVADMTATTIAFEPLYNERGQYLIGLNYSDREYYREILQTGRTTISNVYQGRGGLPLPCIAIGVPLRDREEHMWGFILGWFDLRSFQALVKRHNLDIGAQMVITDKLGQLIADSQLSADDQSIVLNYADKDAFHLALQHRAGFVERQVKGAERQVAAGKAFNRYWLTFNTVKPVDWKVYIDQSSEPIDRQIAGLYFKTIIIVLVLIMLAAGFAQLVSTIIVGPLRELQTSAEQLAAGDFHARPKARNVLTIELASLFSSFNQMATALAQAFDKQRHLYEEISRRESELQNLIGSAYDAICALSPDGHIIWLNQRVAGLTGMEMEQLKDARFEELIYEPDRLLAAGQLTRALADTPNTIEYRLQDLQGELRDLLVTASPVRHGDEVTGVLLIARDITEEKQSKSRALQADKLRAMGQLATGVAHNFNNALAAIIGRAQLMKLKTTEPYIVSGLTVIERAALDSANMVRRIQTFSKRKRQDQLAVEDLSLLLQDAVELTRTRWQDDARVKGLEYNVEYIPAEGIFVNAIASELREVFVNLIINAIDAMPKGGDLMISLTSHKEDALIQFSDSGMGMSTEVRSRLFEPFFTTKGVSGTGLGLSVSYGIISRHNGLITVESELGFGTTFNIRLPLATEIINEVKSDINVKVSALNILVIDDEELVRETLVEYLEFGGHTVSAVADDGDWLDQLKQQEFNLVITDLSMPKVDGYHVAMVVRQGWPQMRILLATGYGDGVDQSMIDDGTIDEILSKPFDLAKINNCLNKLFATVG